MGPGARLGTAARMGTAARGRMGMPSSMGRPVTGMIDADSGPRPMTAIKGVGFTSSGNRGTVTSFVLLIHVFFLSGKKTKRHESVDPLLVLMSQISLKLK